MQEQGDYKPKGKNKICVKVYLNPENFPRYAKLAEKAGKRRGGLQLFKQKKDGFAGEVVPNRKGMAKFFKFAADYWEASEAHRMSEAADIARGERELAERKKKLGMV